MVIVRGYSACTITMYHKQSLYGYSFDVIIVHLGGTIRCWNVRAVGNGFMKVHNDHDNF